MRSVVGGGRRKSGRKDGRMEGWRDGRMERWKDGVSVICMSPSVYTVTRPSVSVCLHD